MPEQWKPVVGYEGLYEVSDRGRVASYHYGDQRILSQNKLTRGYRSCCLCKDGKLKSCLVHRLVAEAFIPNPDNLETVNHIDEDKLNNCVENLEWMTRGDNTVYGTAVERRRAAYNSHPHPKRAPVEVDGTHVVATSLDTGDKIEFRSLRHAARCVNGRQPNITACLKGRQRTAYGYRWEYC